jgi:hypothetical protein
MAVVNMRLVLELRPDARVYVHTHTFECAYVFAYASRVLPLGTPCLSPSLSVVKRFTL